jgi:hypothetical protein
VKVTLYVEGGGHQSKELRVRCREGFRKLLENCGFQGQMPATVACGSRQEAFSAFRTAHAQAQRNEIALLLVDSEEPLANINPTWAHLQARDQWQPPPEATDNQVLLMVTCMETWLVTDRQALQLFYGHCLRESALPSLHNLEGRTRQAVQTASACHREVRKERVSEGRTLVQASCRAHAGDTHAAPAELRAHGEPGQPLAQPA